MNGYWPAVTEFSGVDVKHCEQCGFGFIQPEFSDEFLGTFYRHHYRSKKSVHHIDFSRLNGARSNARSAAQVELAARYVSLSANECFVDVGPGAGSSFVAAEMKFPGIRKVAIELTEEAPDAYRRAFNAETFRDAESFVATGERARLLFVSHCLEHFNPSQLKGFLNGLRQMLAPGGVVMIEVPHADLRLHRRYHVQDAPHCVFFSAGSLRDLFARNGWKVLFIGTAGKRITGYYPLKSDQAVSGLSAKAFNAARRAFDKPLRWLRAQAVKAGIVRDENFIYGGNRVVLRLIATPQDK